MFLSINNKFLQYYVSSLFNSLFFSIIIRDNFLYLNIKRDFLYLFFFILNKHTFFAFNALMDLWGVDFPHKNNRFQINYLFINTLKNYRLILKVKLKNLELIPSINALYNSSGWLEREVWDMFGVFFFGNQDLRRILTDYGFEGFPLRKDFPLTGFYEIFYDYEQKRIAFTNVEFTQEFRFFSFQKPWI